MRVVIQRAKKAVVKVEGKLVNKIDEGLVLLVGFTYNDNLDDINYIIRKIINLRIFSDDKGLMNLNIKDVNGAILSISQFTLYADTKKGNRPSFIRSLKADEAKNLYETFNNELNKYIKTYAGIFQADMQIELINDGPVTISIDSKER